MSGFSGALCNDDRLDFPLKEKSGNTPPISGSGLQAPSPGPEHLFHSSSLWIASESYFATKNPGTCEAILILPVRRLTTELTTD